MHDIRYDEVNDEMLVSNPFARAILVFRGGFDGNEAPIRTIQGSKTELGDPTRYAGGPDRLDVDPVDNEGTLAVDPVNNVFAVAQDTVAAGSNQQAHILIFDRTASGNAKPRGMI